MSQALLNWGVHYFGWQGSKNWHKIRPSRQVKLVQHIHPLSSIYMFPFIFEGIPFSTKISDQNKQLHFHFDLMSFPALSLVFICFWVCKHLKLQISCSQVKSFSLKDLLTIPTDVYLLLYRIMIEVCKSYFWEHIFCKIWNSETLFLKCALLSANEVFIPLIVKFV